VTSSRAEFAEAKLKREGKDVATLTITDLAGNPGARAKLGAASERLNGFPVAENGSDESAILVKDRFTVRVASGALRHDERKVWLSKLDLYGLSTL